MSDLDDDTRSALRELGEAWRGDWNHFDGRTLRATLAPSPFSGVAGLAALDEVDGGI